MPITPTSTQVATTSVVETLHDRSHLAIQAAMSRLGVLYGKRLNGHVLKPGDYPEFSQLIDVARVIGELIDDLAAAIEAVEVSQDDKGAQHD